MTAPTSPSWPNGAQTRSLRDAKRDMAIKNIRAACQRDGVSERMTEECVSSLENAFAVKDMMLSLFGGVR